jgi:methylated-DNA-[protein]-cysteine S-methyltransferase
MSLAYKVVNSPVGMLKLVASDKGLAAILWKNDNPRRVRLEDLVEEPLHPLLVRTDNELKDYFAGNRRTFSVPLDMRGTHFQKQVWEALLGIPFGETRTYGDIAKQLGTPSSYPATESSERLAA